MFVDDNALGVATVGHSSEVLVGRIVGEGHVRAELLKALPAMMAGAIRVDHAADSYEVASFVPRDRRANPGDTAHDLVAGDAGIDRGHDIAPLVTDLMKIGVADAAEENLELHVAFGRIASWNRGGGQWRCRTGR